MIYSVCRQHFRGFLRKGDVPAEIRVFVATDQSITLAVQPRELVSSIILRVWCWMGTQQDLRLSNHFMDAGSQGVLLHVGLLLGTKSLFDQGVFGPNASVALVRKRTDADAMQIWPDDVCANCNAYPVEGLKFQKCKHCKDCRAAVRYCSKACQIADWPLHK